MWTERTRGSLLTGSRIHAPEEALRQATIRRSDGASANFADLFIQNSRDAQWTASPGRCSLGPQRPA